MKFDSAQWLIYVSKDIDHADPMLQIRVS